MGLLNENRAFETIIVRLEEDICYLQIHRPEANNAINDTLIAEMNSVLDACEPAVKIVVIEGLPEVFCFGADFKELQQSFDTNQPVEQDPGPLYDLWLKLACGPYVSIAHVRGKVNAGGIGFVAACDLALCEDTTVFSLSELLFGLIPACVLPFLIRRMGVSKANYMTLMTQPVSSKQALEWGLVDATEANSSNLLRKHLLRLRRLSKTGITRYKRYIHTLDSALEQSKPDALQANLEVFSDETNLAKISRYVRTGRFPWEGGT